MGKNESFTDMISGTIYNHPFLLYTIKTQTMVPVTYTGSTSISYRDSEGNMQTEILTASHVEPMPVYNRENYISLKSNLVEKLEYSNSASLKSLRKVNKAYKNSGQEKMDNEEFDRLFPTTRNDELAFRVMFTVLTQEKFVELFNTAGQYSLFKSGLYTTSYVPSQIKKKSKKASYVGSMPSHYIDYHFYEMYGDDSYDLDELKKQKSDSVKEFIKAFGFMQLPFANMPVIARETYKESDKPTKDKYNGIQNEVLANLNFERNFGGRYDTEVILSSKNNTTFTFNKKSCILTELDADYFIEEHTTVSEYVRGSHGGATVIIHIVVYHPRTAKYYLVQCHDFDKKYDYFTKSGARVVDGVYYKLFDHKPTEADLKKEFCK
ncbi:MAG: hypothetical protein K2M43_03320 [Mycoplasmoidaceae bacterium]|nr:hypothetical protein [Mycoplasmoidaceae bacterium]